MKRLACSAAILPLGIGVGPFLLLADMIHGTTNGSAAGPEFGMDDPNTVVASNIQALKSYVILAYAIDGAVKVCVLLSTAKLP